MTREELEFKARMVGGENMTPTNMLFCGLLIVLVEKLDELITLIKDADQ